MIPFFKAFSLVVRVFSRPLLNYTKKYHSANGVSSSKIRMFFIWFGNFYHRMQSQVNRRFLKIQSQFAFKPLNEQLAIQKGIQFFYQIILYSIIIGFPLYEMWVATQESKMKAEKLQKRLSDIQVKIETICKRLEDKQHEQNLIKSCQQSIQKISRLKFKQRVLHQQRCFQDIKLQMGWFDQTQKPKKNFQIQYRMCLL